ncbi:MAG TPA: amidohydrolase family protein [Capsulimonadaceae bacterium]|jgi:predicted TIM-barrel fold metal-dependent hydrolase
MDIIDINTIFGAFPNQRAESTAEALVDTLSKNEVSQALTLSSWGIHYNDMSGNQETLRACSQFKTHLIPVGTINPMQFWDGDEMLKQIVQTSFGVIRLFPEKQGWPIDYAPFSRLVDVLSELGKPLLERELTLPRATRGWRLWKDSGVPLMIEITRPGDATQLQRIVADYPAPVVMVGVTTSTVVEALTVMRMSEQLLIETHKLAAPDGLGRIRDAVGADRIVFGSGGPGLSVRASLDYVRKSSLTDAEQAAVLGGNASSILQGGR